MCVELWPHLGVHLLQAVLVSLSVRFFPVYPAERFVLNGKVKVMLRTMSRLRSLIVAGIVLEGIVY